MRRGFAQTFKCPQVAKHSSNFDEEVCALIALTQSVVRDTLLCLCVFAAGGGGAAESPTVAPIPSAGSDDDDDDLPPMPDANPPQVPADMPKKYTATEWV